MANLKRKSDYDSKLISWSKHNVSIHDKQAEALPSYLVTEAEASKQLEASKQAEAEAVKKLVFNYYNKAVVKDKSVSQSVSQSEARQIRLVKREENMIKCARREYGNKKHEKTFHDLIGFDCKTVARNDCKSGITTTHDLKDYEKRMNSPRNWSLKGCKYYIAGVKYALNDKKLEVEQSIRKRIPKKHTSSKLYPQNKSNHTNPKNRCINDSIRRKNLIAKNKSLKGWKGCK